MTSPSFRTAERLLLGLFLLLSILLLIRHWGQTVGHDSGSSLNTTKLFQEYGVFHPMDETYTGYHPFLSFALAVFLSLFTGNIATGALLLSFFSVIGGMLLLRSALKQIGILHSAAGILFLYLSAALPLFIYLARATTYDSLQFFLGMLTLSLSIRTFWNFDAKPPVRTWLIRDALPLAVALTAGLFTKYSCLPNFAMPGLVLLVRYGRHIPHKAFTIWFLSAAIALLLATPYYGTRYYKETGKLLPIGMEWQQPEAVQKERARREEHPVQFTVHILRIPLTLYNSKFAETDSLWHTLWFQTWKADLYWIHPPPLARVISTVYATLFLPFFASGFAFFLLEHRSKKGRKPLVEFGWILLLNALILCMMLTVFAYRYPLLDWVVFKPKYIAIGMLWVPFCIAFVFNFLLQLLPGKCRIPIVVILLALFMGTNFLLPIY